MTTPHINATDDAFYKTVLMPGDPLRAKYIAENYLDNAKLVTDVRGMLGFSGTFKKKGISVMGSGMGIPSIGIYAHELYSFYGVENIIRIGSCGGYSEDVDVGSIIAAQGACTNSNFLSQYGLEGTYAPIADFSLLLKAHETAEKMGIKLDVGNILSSDTFYSQDTEAWKKWKDMGVLGVEMESAGLYAIASKLGKKALGIFTVSDHFIHTGHDMTSAERERSLDEMIRLSLEAFCDL